MISDQYVWFMESGKKSGGLQSTQLAAWIERAGLILSCQRNGPVRRRHTPDFFPFSLLADALPAMRAES